MAFNIVFLGIPSLTHCSSNRPKFLFTLGSLEPPPAARNNNFKNQNLVYLHFKVEQPFEY